MRHIAHLTCNNFTREGLDGTWFAETEFVIVTGEPVYFEIEPEGCDLTKLEQLKQARFVASAEALRELARFALDAADRLDALESVVRRANRALKTKTKKRGAK
jgi:hypothetical protein